MLDVGIAGALRLLVVFEIEVAIGKAEAALSGNGDHAVALLEVLPGAEIEDGRHAHAM